MASGDYSLRPINPGSDSTAYLLYRMTDAQKKAMIERMPKPAESPFFVTGSEFRPFKDKALDGTKIDLKALRGKVVVLNFWFINCPPCRMEIPELNKIAAEYKDKDVVFVAVALDQGYEIKDFLKTTPYNYHIVSDGRYTANKYGITSYPTNVVIDKDGIIKFHSSGYGASTAVWIRKSIDQAM
jgi:thiol-disulfide isomerase/thioredoxin